MTNFLNDGIVSKPEPKKRGRKPSATPKVKAKGPGRRGKSSLIRASDIVSAMPSVSLDTFKTLDAGTFLSDALMVTLDGAVSYDSWTASYFDSLAHESANALIEGVFDRNEVGEPGNVAFDMESWPEVVKDQAVNLIQNIDETTIVNGGFDVPVMPSGVPARWSTVKRHLNGDSVFVGILVKNPMNRRPKAVKGEDDTYVIQPLHTFDSEQPDHDLVFVGYVIDGDKAEAIDAMAHVENIFDSPKVVTNVKTRARKAKVVNEQVSEAEILPTISDAELEKQRQAAVEKRRAQIAMLQARFS